MITVLFADPWINYLPLTLDHPRSRILLTFSKKYIHTSSGSPVILEISKA